jgi:hypothetical protein
MLINSTGLALFCHKMFEKIKSSLKLLQLVSEGVGRGRGTAGDSSGGGGMQQVPGEGSNKYLRPGNKCNKGPV